MMNDDDKQDCAVAVGRLTAVGAGVGCRVTSNGHLLSCKLSTSNRHAHKNGNYGWRSNQFERQTNNQRKKHASLFSRSSTCFVPFPERASQRTRQEEQRDQHHHAYRHQHKTPPQPTTTRTQRTTGITTAVFRKEYRERKNRKIEPWRRASP